MAAKPAFLLFLRAGLALCFAAASVDAQQKGTPVPKDGAPPPTAQIRLGSAKMREGQNMTGLEFLPDGKHLVTTAAGLVHYWDV